MSRWWKKSISSSVSGEKRLCCTVSCWQPLVWLEILEGVVILQGFRLNWIWTFDTELYLAQFSGIGFCTLHEPFLHTSASAGPIVALCRSQTMASCTSELLQSRMLTGASLKLSSLVVFMTSPAATANHCESCIPITIFRHNYLHRLMISATKTMTYATSAMRSSTPSMIFTWYLEYQWWAVCYYDVLNINYVFFSFFFPFFLFFLITDKTSSVATGHILCTSHNFLSSGHECLNFKQSSSFSTNHDFFSAYRNFSPDLRLLF